jgi:hypothetical protein
MAEGLPRADLTICGGFEKVNGPEQRKDTKRKGLEMAEHIMNIKEIRQSGTCTITSQCIREMSLSGEPYKVELTLDPETRDVVDAKCTCQAGVTGLCKHTAGLVEAVNSERSTGCTDSSQGWLKPSQKLQSLYPKGETIQQLVLGKRPERRNFHGERATLNDLAALLQKHNLQNSSMYKSITVDVSISQVFIWEILHACKFLFSVFHFTY